MEQTLLTAGIACLVAAVVGGGLKAFGIEVPALQSILRQSLLAVIGLALLATVAAMRWPVARPASIPASGTGEYPTAAVEPTPSIGASSASPSLLQAQRLLIRLGYAVGPADGIGGPRTTIAIRDFQQKHQLAADGMPGSATLAALTTAAKGDTP